MTKEKVETPVATGRTRKPIMITAQEKKAIALDRKKLEQQKKALEKALQAARKAKFERDQAKKQAAARTAEIRSLKMLLMHERRRADMADAKLGTATPTAAASPAPEAGGLAQLQAQYNKMQAQLNELCTVTRGGVAVQPAVPVVAAQPVVPVPIAQPALAPVTMEGDQLDNLIMTLNRELTDLKKQVSEE
jgi:hypothetical protein